MSKESETVRENYNKYSNNDSYIHPKSFFRKYDFKRQTFMLNPMC